MKAVVYTASGKAEVRNIRYAPPGEGQALIRVMASGLCHTDIDILHGRYGSSTYPLVPGHEYAGVVEEIGPGVTDLSPGDRVVIDPNIGCGVCRQCRSGRSNLCETLGAYGVTLNGGFAELSTVATENLVRIGDMPYEIAAFAEPMGCVLNGVEAIGTTGVQDAMIFGAGPIGLLMAMAVRSRNVARVTVVDIDQSRLDLAESLGFAPLLSGSEDLAKRKQDVDLVIDATGVPAVTEKTLNYVADGGKVLFFGVCPPDFRMEISPFEIFRRQLKIAGSHSLNHNINAALDVIRSVGSDLHKLVSHSVPLDEIPKYVLGQASGSRLKVQAVPG